MLSPASEISASVMCMDFSRLDEQLDALHSAGVTRLHLDFGDGHFVPNLILGTEVFQLLRHHDDFRVETHLMIDDPGRFLHLFAKGSHIVIFHPEAAPDPQAFIREIRRAGLNVGIALRPETPARALLPILNQVDHVLVLTVEPGFAGSPFIPEMVAKVKELKEALARRNPHADLAVDGAINQKTIPALAAAGANVFVGGSSGLFTGDDLARQAREMVSWVRGQHAAE
jgi:ribulose-phosphate 3-epimerase